MRIGIGYDIHRLEAGSGIHLGGLSIPCPYQFIAHSDGDVVLHALCDALLGALALGDLGAWFPDTDPQFARRESSYFIDTIRADERVQPWVIGNIDCNIIAQTPRLACHRDAMRARIAALVATDVGNVSIKARTNEHCDAVGEKQAIIAQVVLTLLPRS